MPTAALPLHRTFQSKLANFSDDQYEFRDSQHITKLMRALLEDPGVGHLHKIQTAARLAETLGGTKYSELDYFFGAFLQLPRLPVEMYPYEPFTDQLTANQWREVAYKDLSYRERISLFLQAIIRGGTNDGLAMAAEAASGVSCAVLELWRYSDNAGLPSNPGRIGSPQEIVIVPRTTGLTLDNSQRRGIYNAVARLKPATTMITVDEHGLSVRTIISLRHVAAPDEYFEIRRYVTGVDPPTPSLPDRYYWIKNGIQVEAPTFADLMTQSTAWQLNGSVTNVETFELAGTIQTPLPPALSTAGVSWTEWRQIELADSPDNYPNGKYQGQAAKYDSAGNYIFAWPSQAAFLAWLSQWVLAQGGEISTDRYRLPISAQISFGQVSSPEDALAPVRVRVQSTYYGR